MKKLTSLLTLTLLLAHISAACADWTVDFDDGTMPGEFTTFAWDIDWLNPTNVSMDAADETLRVWDSDGLSPNNFGTKEFDWIGPEVFDGDVRASAEINPNGDSIAMLGVLLSPPIEYDQAGYWAVLDLKSGTNTSGRIMGGKGGAWTTWWDAGAVADLNRSYFMEMELTDREARYPLITVRVLDSEDGDVLLEGDYRDLDYNDSLPYRPLQGGIIAFTYNTDPLNANFDNISAISLDPLAWDRLGDGMWSDATRWDSDELGRTPNTGTPVTVETNVVTVPADTRAGSLVIDHDGHLVVQKDATLVVARDVQIDNGTLELAAGGVLETKGEVRFDVGSQFVCQVGQESNGMVLSSTASGDIAISPGSSLQFQVSGASMFKAGFRTLMLTAGTNGITGEFETVSGLGNYVTGNGLSYDNGWLSLTIDNDLNLGDADLSTTTDLSDFNLWNANKFMSGTDWTTGDFNGDGTTDLSDFNIWNAAKFTSAGGGAAPAPTQVPEPSSLLMLLASGLCLVALAYRRRSC